MTTSERIQFHGLLLKGLGYSPEQIAQNTALLRLEERIKRRYWALSRAVEEISARALAEGVRTPSGFTGAQVLEVRRKKKRRAAT